MKYGTLSSKVLALEKKTKNYFLDRGLVRLETSKISDAEKNWT